MRYLIVTILILRFFGDPAFSQYISIRDNVFDTTTEEYTRNSPTNTIGNSRFGRGTRDTFFTKFYYNRVHFMRYDSSRNDGDPSIGGLLWINNNGRINRSPVSSLNIPTNTSQLVNGSGFLNTESDPIYSSGITNYYTKTQGDSRYLQNYTETDPIYLANIINYYNKTQSDSRYLQSFTETDPTVSSVVKAITSSNISNWNTAFGWGNHSTQGYLKGSDTISLSNRVNLKESSISSGTTLQYWRGDKTWQTLDKSVVGLSNVDNTSDLNKPISTLTQTALNTKFNAPTGTTNQYVRGDGSLSTFPTINTSQFYDKTGLLTSTAAYFSDTFTINTSTPTISLASYMSAAGKSNMKIKSVTGIRITGSPTATSSPQVSISAVSSNSVTLVLTQANPATVTILGINVLSGLPLVLLSDFTGVKVVVDAVFY